MACAFALTVSACGDSTGPGSENGATVTIAVSDIVGPGVTTDPQGNPQVSCQVHLTATTTGQESASWSGGELLFYFGKDRSVPLDTLALSKNEVAETWGDGTLRVGATQKSIWNVWANFPFLSVLDLRYETAGKTKHVRTPVVCGPPVNATTPAPTISPITMTPASGELSAGTSATVSFSIDAPAGLWETSVQVTGPCDWNRTIREALQVSRTHQIDLPIPGSCQLGVPITVRVNVVDGANQQATRTLSSSVVLVDHDPPQIAPLYFRPNGGSLQPVPSGEYFGGDTIVILSNAGDNHALAAVVWEVLPYGARDSTVLREGSTIIGVPLHPEWSGPIQIKLWARDEVGLVSDTVLTPADSLRVRPTAFRPTRTTTVAKASWDFAIDSRRELLYLRQDNEHRIAVVSLATMQIQSTIPLAGMPVELDIAPSGDSLFVLLYGRPAVEVIDVRGSTPLSTEVPIGLDASENQTIAHVRTGANGKIYLTTTGASAGTRSLIEFDLASGSQRRRADAGVSGTVNPPLAASLDRSVLALMAEPGHCAQFFYLRSDTFSACVPVASFGEMNLDGSGHRLAMSQDVYDEALHLLPKAMPPLFSGNAVPLTLLSLDGESLFVSHPTLGFVRFRASDNTMLDRTPNTVKPMVVRMSADGTMIVSLETDYYTSTKISVIDLR